MSTWPALGRLKAMIRLTSVLLPEPLEPTRAVVVPAGASKETPLSTGRSSSYSKWTSRSTTRPRTSERGSSAPSWASSASSFVTSRMRSSPARASLIWVPMADIWMIGWASTVTKATYMIRSPKVMVPAWMARPPKKMSSTPMAPTMMVATAVMALVPVMERLMFWNSRRTPAPKSRCSRASMR